LRCRIALMRALAEEVEAADARQQQAAAAAEEEGVEGSFVGEDDGAGRGGRSASTVQKVVTFAAEQLLPCFVALVASSRLAASGSVDGAGAVPMAYYPPWVTAVSFLRAQLQSAPCARESKSEVGYFITTLGT